MSQITPGLSDSLLLGEAHVHRDAGVIFGEALQSAPYFSELFKRQMHYSVGFGGRLALNRSEKLHARGDLSLVDGKHIGITIDLRESF